ncbi:uncharacterized protein LOC120073559 [Benincasa hispida]|uniref:uncharacterized protein LOC120073559 n=1 Tax=Benincasa hispida TaxID=102211 RepID=UPI001900F355|nr:uncharacterized protein LOC120073559 [Benincasa hispida]
MKDYDCEILYHLGKANVVADALSRKTTHSTVLITKQVYLCNDLKQAKIAVAVREDTELTGRLCVPADNGLRSELLAEVHSSLFSIHPGSTKIYQDLKQYYWWSNMKRETVDYLSKCLVCQQVKAPRQKPGSLLQPLNVPKWK